MPRAQLNAMMAGRALRWVATLGPLAQVYLQLPPRVAT